MDVEAEEVAFDDLDLLAFLVVEVVFELDSQAVFQEARAAN